MRGSWILDAKFENLETSIQYPVLVIMEPTFRNQDVFTFYSINQAMFPVNPSGPESTKLIFQRFQFAQTGKMIA